MKQSEPPEIFIVFQLHRCRNWTQPKNLLEGIKTAIDLGGLIPLENKKIELEGRKKARPVVKNIPSWFQQNYHYEEVWDNKEFGRLEPKEGFGVSLRLPLEEAWITDELVWGAMQTGFDARTFGEAYNIVEFSCLLQRGKTMGREDEVMDLYLKFTHAVINQLRPEYAVVTDKYLDVPYGHNEIATQLKVIHWCNYFGPMYLQKYGEAIFLDAPQGKVEKLDDGIWYQLSEKFSDSKDNALQDQVLAHFKSIGVQAVV